MFSLKELTFFMMILKTVARLSFVWNCGHRVIGGRADLAVMQLSQVNRTDIGSLLLLMLIVQKTL